MAADAELFELDVRQLAAWIQFEGVAQRDALRICANQVNRFYIERRIF
jgi:hypothetical protein